MNRQQDYIDGEMEQMTYTVDGEMEQMAYTVGGERRQKNFGSERALSGVKNSLV